MGKEKTRDEKEVDSLLLKIKEAKYSKKTRDIIIEYAQKLKAEEKSPCTIKLYARSLHYLGEYAGTRSILKLDLDKDIHKFRLWLQENKNTKITSQFHHLNDVRCFYLHYFPDTELVKKKLKFINEIKKKMMPRLTADEYSTYKDILRLVEGASSPLRKALIYFGWESGLRAGTLVKVQVKDLKKIEYNGKDVFQLEVKQENIKGRRAQCVPKPVLIQCVPHLLRWLESHQFKGKGESPLFYGKIKNGVPQEMNVKSLNQMIKRTAKSINFEKRIFWHALRHSHTKYLLSNGYSEGVVKAWHGLSEKSNMLSVYSKWSGGDVLDAAAQKQGLVVEEEEETIQESKECPRCKHTNTFESKFCVKCWYVLDPQEALELQKKSVLNNSLEDMVNKAVEAKIAAMK